MKRHALGLLLALLPVAAAAQVYNPPNALVPGGALFTLGSTAITYGSTVTTVAGLTLSGGTLSGTTTLPGSGQITSGGLLGLGVTPTTIIHLSAAAPRISLRDTGLSERTVYARADNNGTTNFVALGVRTGGDTANQDMVLADVNGVSIAGPNKPIAKLNIGTTAGTARIYNLFTDASNSEWAYLGSWAANVSTFGTAHNGSGVARDVSLVYDGTERIRLVTGGINLPSLPSDATHTDNTVCADTSTGLLYKGSGAVGICLGTSSARFKHDISPLRPGLAQIMALQPVSYRYNKGYGDDGARELYGFTAEQVADVLPELVGHDAEGRPNSVDWAGIVPVLVKAIQELKESEKAAR
jgi:hypothetical protein